MLNRPENPLDLCSAEERRIARHRAGKRWSKMAADLTPPEEIEKLTAEEEAEDRIEKAIAWLLDE